MENQHTFFRYQNNPSFVQDGTEMIRNRSNPIKDNTTAKSSPFTKRGRFRIIYDILSVSRKHSHKTNILYGANLSFHMLEKYLDLLVTQRMIMIKDGLFLITDKGKESLNIN